MSQVGPSANGTLILFSSDLTGQLELHATHQFTHGEGNEFVAATTSPSYNERSPPGHGKMLMLKRNDLVEAFEKEQMRREPPDHQRNLRVVEALYEHARRLGALPLKDPLDGIEVDLRLARILNVRGHTDTHRPAA